MTKKRIMILALLFVLGTAGFAGSFLASRYMAGPAPAEAATGRPTNAATALGSAGALPPPPSASAPSGARPEAQVPSIEEKHLYDLIREMRLKLAECDRREALLAEDERRLAIARKDLLKQAEDLEALRVQLAATVAQVKDAQASMEQSRVTITSVESANLKRVAAVYDKMDAGAGGKILEGMCTNRQEADAVKILYYMSERTVAKVLAEMADKALAARLCEQMKLIREQG